MIQIPFEIDSSGMILPMYLVYQLKSRALIWIENVNCIQIFQAALSNIELSDVGIHIPSFLTKMA